VAGREVGTSSVYVELARIYERMAQPGEALATLEYGRRIAQSDEIDEELADLYLGNGELERAAITYLEALSLNPDRSPVAGKLVELYRRIDPQGCALANGTLNLGCPLVHKDVCAASRNVAQLFGAKGREADNVRSQAIDVLGCPAELFAR
jgi:tetratricopeptide (TPR) repeat protein